jgi:hypothetical protein
MHLQYLVILVYAVICMPMNDINTNECIGIHVKSKEIEFVGRITKMKDRLYIEIPKDHRKAFEEFSKDSLVVKVRKVLG